MDRSHWNLFWSLPPVWELPAVIGCGNTPHPSNGHRLHTPLTHTILNVGANEANCTKLLINMEKQQTASAWRLNSDVLQLLSVSRHMSAVLLTCLRERAHLCNLHQASFMHQRSHYSCRSSASAATPPLPRFPPFVPYDSRVSLICTCTHDCICQHFFLIILSSACC